MVSRTEDDVVYRFSVSDTGIGMSEKFQKHILKHLHKRIQERITVYRGTSLGMAIAKLVDALCGTIKIKKEKKECRKYIYISSSIAIDKDYENASVQSGRNTQCGRYARIACRRQ